MILRLRLSAADQARLGCPDVMDIDPLSMTVREAAALAGPFWLDETGVGLMGFYTPDEWRRLLRGIPVLDREGRPVLSDRPERDENGQAVTDDAGAPVMRPLMRSHWGAEMALVWLALRRAGCVVSPADLEYDPERVSMEYIQDADADPGKAEASSTTP